MNSIFKIGVNALKFRNSNYLLRFSSYGTQSSIRCLSKPENNKFLLKSYSTDISPKCETLQNAKTAETAKENKSTPVTSNSSSGGGGGSGEPPSSSGMKYFLVLLALALGGGGAYYSGAFNSDGSKKSGPACKKKRKPKVPASSADIPKEVPYLLIGGGTASFSAFRAIKSHDPKAKVMVISKENEMPYMRPPLSKELWFNRDKKSDDIFKFKQWNGVERSLFYEPDDFYVAPQELLNSPNGGVSIVRGYEVKEINVCDRSVVLDDGTIIKYGECLIATGSAPRRLDVFEKAPKNVQDKVSVFKTTTDFENLRNTLKKVKSIAIVGGGFLGSELACALSKFDENSQLKVHQLFYEEGNMGKVLPTYLSNWATERVREEGVNVMPKSQIKSVENVGSQLKLDLVDGRHLFVDHVLLATGSIPNTNLAGTSKLEVDEKHGGYLVNAELEARSHLYVAGDAACFYDPKLGRRRVEHHDHAVVSGRLAGENMVGLKKPYTHQSMFWSDLGPYVGYEAIGIIDASLPTVGVFAKRTADDVPSSSKTEKFDGKTDEPPKLEAVGSTKPDATPVQKPVVETTVAKTNNEKDSDDENYGKGVVFYLRDDKVVGVLLWNVFNRIGLARKVIAENKKFEDLNEVAKLFDIFEQKSS